MITTKMTAPSAELRELVIPTAHTLIAGTTGSGKSVLLNSLLYSLVLDPSTEFYLVDTKRVELKCYATIKGRTHRVTEPEDVYDMLAEVIDIMDDRYSTMQKKETTEHRIYIVIDELADLVDGFDGREILGQLVKIGRLGRAAHIHLICCTQDPSRRTLSAQLMHNFTTCFGLRCKDKIESRQVIGIDGAEKLPKYGKAIVSNADGYKTIKVPFTPDEDIEEMCRCLALLEVWKDDVRFCRENSPAWMPDPKCPAWIDPALYRALEDGTWVKKWVRA